MNKAQRRKIFVTTRDSADLWEEMNSSTMRKKKDLSMIQSHMNSIVQSKLAVRRAQMGRIQKKQIENRKFRFLASKLKSLADPPRHQMWVPNHNFSHLTNEDQGRPTTTPEDLVTSRTNNGDRNANTDQGRAENSPQIWSRGLERRDPSNSTN